MLCLLRPRCPYLSRRCRFGGSRYRTPMLATRYFLCPPARLATGRNLVSACSTVIVARNRDPIVPRSVDDYARRLRITIPPVIPLSLCLPTLTLSFLLGRVHAAPEGMRVSVQLSIALKNPLVAPCESHELRGSVVLGAAPPGRRGETTPRSWTSWRGMPGPGLPISHA
jgi:hypothetical protein